MKTQTFTRYLTEESLGYSKLKSKKFRKIRFNESEKSIMADGAGAAIAGVSLYVEDSNSYYQTFNAMKSKRQVAVAGMEDFEVFYSFSSALRGDKKYGNANWSARFLYEFLCSNFNQGERFVDTYLNLIFTHRPVYKELKFMVENVQDGIIERWNSGNLKGGQWSSFYKFQSAQMQYLKTSLAVFSKDIRADIIMCLSSGIIPLKFSLAQTTVAKRIALGLNSSSPFYATTWLINQIEVHVVLGSAGDGQLFYSDSYKGDA